MIWTEQAAAPSGVWSIAHLDVGGEQDSGDSAVVPPPMRKVTTERVNIGTSAANLQHDW